MGMPSYQTITAVGTATAVGLDWTLVPFNARVAVELEGSTTATFGVQYTLDDVNDASITAEWFYDPTIGSNTTAVFVASIDAPIRFVRLETTALSSGGSIRFAVLQGLPV